MKPGDIIKPRWDHAVLWKLPPGSGNRASMRIEMKESDIGLAIAVFPEALLPVCLILFRMKWGWNELSYFKKVGEEDT